MEFGAVWIGWKGGGVPIPLCSPLVRLLIRVIRSFYSHDLPNNIPNGERSEKPTIDR